LDKGTSIWMKYLPALHENSTDEDWNYFLSNKQIRCERLQKRRIYHLRFFLCQKQIEHSLLLCLKHFEHKIPHWLCLLFLAMLLMNFETAPKKFPFRWTNFGYKSFCVFSLCCNNFEFPLTGSKMISRFRQRLLPIFCTIYSVLWNFSKYKNANSVQKLFCSLEGVYRHRQKLFFRNAAKAQNLFAYLAKTIDVAQTINWNFLLLFLHFENGILKNARTSHLGKTVLRRLFFSIK